MLSLPVLSSSFILTFSSFILFSSYLLFAHPSHPLSFFASCICFCCYLRNPSDSIPSTPQHTFLNNSAECRILASFKFSTLLCSGLVYSTLQHSMQLFSSLFIYLSNISLLHSYPQNYINAAGFARRLLELPDMNSERNAESRSKVHYLLVPSCSNNYFLIGQGTCCCSSPSDITILFSRVPLSFISFLSLFQVTPFPLFQSPIYQLIFTCLVFYLTPPFFSRSQAQKVLQKSEQQGRNEITIDYDEMNPFRWETHFH